MTELNVIDLSLIGHSYNSSGDKLIIGHYEQSPTSWPTKRHLRTIGIKMQVFCSSFSVN